MLFTLAYSYQEMLILLFSSSSFISIFLFSLYTLNGLLSQSQYRPMYGSQYSLYLLFLSFCYCYCFFCFMSCLKLLISSSFLFICQLQLLSSSSIIQSDDYHEGYYYSKYSFGAQFLDYYFYVSLFNFSYYCQSGLLLGFYFFKCYYPIYEFGQAYLYAMFIIFSFFFYEFKQGRLILFKLQFILNYQTNQYNSQLNIKANNNNNNQQTANIDTHMHYERMAKNLNRNQRTAPNENTVPLPITLRNGSTHSLISLQNYNHQQYLLAHQQTDYQNLQPQTLSNKNLSSYKSIPLIDIISKSQFEQLYNTISIQSTIQKQTRKSHDSQIRKQLDFEHQIQAKQVRRRFDKMQQPVRKFWRHSKQDYFVQQQQSTSQNNKDQFQQSSKKVEPTYYQQFVRWKEGQQQYTMTPPISKKKLENIRLNINHQNNYNNYNSKTINDTRKNDLIDIDDAKPLKQGEQQQYWQNRNKKQNKQLKGQTVMTVQQDLTICQRDYMRSRMRTFQNEYQQKIKQLVTNVTNGYFFVPSINAKNEATQNTYVKDNNLIFSAHRLQPTNFINERDSPSLASQQVQTFEEQIYAKVNRNNQQFDQKSESQSQDNYIDGISFQHLISRPPTYLNLKSKEKLQMNKKTLEIISKYEIENRSGRNIRQDSDTMKNNNNQYQDIIINRHKKDTRKIQRMLSHQSQYEQQQQEKIKQQLIQLYAETPFSFADQQKQQLSSFKEQQSSELYKHQNIPSPKVKLNIEKLIKLKAKEFLVFYSQNYRKIINLCSPQQLNRLNRYRQRCLDKQSSIQKLRKTISQKGETFINKLSSEQKQKLFKVLYGDYPQLQQTD